MEKKTLLQILADWLAPDGRVGKYEITYSPKIFVISRKKKLKKDIFKKIS